MVLAIRAKDVAAISSGSFISPNNCLTAYGISPRCVRSWFIFISVFSPFFVFNKAAILETLLALSYKDLSIHSLTACSAFSFLISRARFSICSSVATGPSSRLASDL